MNEARTKNEARTRIMNEARTKATKNEARTRCDRSKRMNEARTKNEARTRIMNEARTKATKNEARTRCLAVVSSMTAGGSGYSSMQVSPLTMRAKSLACTMQSCLLLTTGPARQTISVSSNATCTTRVLQRCHEPLKRTHHPTPLPPIPSPVHDQPTSHLPLPPKQHPFKPRRSEWVY